MASEDASARPPEGYRQAGTEAIRGSEWIEDDDPAIEDTALKDHRPDLEWNREDPRLALAAAAEAAACTISGRSSWIGERELGLCVESALRARNHRVLLEMGINLGDHWHGRVGPVDLVLGPSEHQVLVELKWDHTLAACAWDAMKLASAVHAGKAERAFMIAGSPLEEGLRGADLLESRAHEALALHLEYRAEFESWADEVINRPSRPPRSWTIEACERSHLIYNEARWQIRLAEVVDVSDELVELAAT